MYEKHFAQLSTSTKFIPESVASALYVAVVIPESKDPTESATTDATKSSEVLAPAGRVPTFQTRLEPSISYKSPNS